jgi:hypothetical protein
MNIRHITYQFLPQLQTPRELCSIGSAQKTRIIDGRVGRSPSSLTHLTRRLTKTISKSTKHRVSSRKHWHYSNLQSAEFEFCVDNNCRNIFYSTMPQHQQLPQRGQCIKPQPAQLVSLNKYYNFR